MLGHIDYPFSRFVNKACSFGTSFTVFTGVVAAIQGPTYNRINTANNSRSFVTSQPVLWLENEQQETQKLTKAKFTDPRDFTNNHPKPQTPKMTSTRAPKQWTLTKNETITSFEAWRQNLQYTLSLDVNFASFLGDTVTWLKKSQGPLRGFTDDGEAIPTARRRTAQQKCTHLELMLGQIANYCPVISRNSIVKNSTSINAIWQMIRMHYGFQSTGAHFIDFNNIKLEHDERPEDLFQRLMSFVEDNLLIANGNITHHGEAITTDEESTPSLENMIVLTWLRLIHPDLPNLVKQRYGTELRSRTLASIKPEISQALDSLLDELRTAADSKVLRATASKFRFPASREPNKSPKPHRPSN